VPLDIARRRAARLGLAVDFRRCDMRDLGRHFAAAFDCVLTCGALDNVTGRSGVPAALRGMYRALWPGGLWYAWLRDLEWVLAHEPRYKCKGVRAVPHGRVVTVEDWLPAGAGHVVHVYAHLHEDVRRRPPDEPWRTEALGYRRRVLPKAALAAALGAAGFEGIVLFPQPHPWEGYRVLARRPDP
jgi:ubiquinone/menaquinone biosynthesis C-methylase UbiE